MAGHQSLPSVGSVVMSRGERCALVQIERRKAKRIVSVTLGRAVTPARKWTMVARTLVIHRASKGRETTSMWELESGNEEGWH